MTEQRVLACLGPPRVARMFDKIEGCSVGGSAGFAVGVRVWVGAPASGATKGSFYERLAVHGHEIVVDGDFAHLYADGRGRPSVPPSVMVRVS